MTSSDAIMENDDRRSEIAGVDTLLLLASGSPRRSEILTTLGIPFEIDVPNVEETLGAGELGERAVSRLATAMSGKLRLMAPLM